MLSILLDCYINIDNRFTLPVKEEQVSCSMITSPYEVNNVCLYSWLTSKKFIFNPIIRCNLVHNFSREYIVSERQGETTAQCKTLLKAKFIRL